jgi:hypothetical protein
MGGPGPLKPRNRPLSGLEAAVILGVVGLIVLCCVGVVAIGALTPVR